MKNLLTTLLLLAGVSAFGQGTAIRSQNGFGTNTSFYGTVTNATINQMGSSVLGSLWTLLDTNGLNRIAIVSTNMTFRDTNNIQLRISPNGVEAVTVGFVGDGSGLTNLVFGEMWVLDSGVYFLDSSQDLIRLDSGGLSVSFIGTIVNSTDVFIYGNGANVLSSDFTTAIGEGAIIDTSPESIAIGQLTAITNATRAIVIGRAATTLSGHTILIGGASQIDANSDSSIAIGRGSSIGELSNDAIAIGHDANIGTNAYESIAIGSSAMVADNADGAVAIGRFAVAGNTNDFVLGDSSHRVSTPGTFAGNGGGLTNLVGATNFSSSVTYNFNGKTTFNAVSYNTNAWAGPTNPIVLTTNYQFFVASTDCEITGVSGQLADQNTWATLTVSNSTASPITVRSTATGFRPQGAATSSAMVIGAGKEGYLSYHSRGVLSTNFVTTSQQ